MLQRKGPRSVRVVTIALVLAGALVGIPNQASASPQRPSNEQIRVVLDRIEDGTWTEKDIDLLKQAPDLARHVPDPRDKGTVGVVFKRVSPPSEGSDGSDVSITGCYWAHVWVDKNDVFGSRIYRFNTRTDWCGSNGRVTSVDRHEGWISDQTWGIYFNSWEVDSWGILGDGRGYHNKRAAVDYCLPDIGCYTQTHPYINVTMTEFLYPGSYGYSYSAG